MANDKTYSVQLNGHELSSLTECLAVLRKKLVADLGSTASEDPIFVSACQIAFKFGKVRFPNSNVTLMDYFDLAEE
jgi:hypothetical protein